MLLRKKVGWSKLLMLSFTAALMIVPNLQASEKKEILIGAPISMTGAVAMSGLEQKWAYEQAVDDINKEGGLFLSKLNKKLPVKLVTADDESEPGKAAAAMEKLIKLDKVDLLLSNQAAPLVLPACIVAEKYKKFMAATVCFPFMWSPNKFKWSTNMFFRASMASEVPFKIWETLPKEQRPKKIALFLEDSPDGIGFGAGFVESAKKFGYTFVVNEPMAVGAKDYSSQILKMKFNKVDAVLLFGSPTDSVTFVRQMKETGLNVKYLHGWKGTWTSEFAQALGKDADGILCDGFWSEDLPVPGAKELGERYKAKFNKHSVSTGIFYANAQILFKAIEKAGTYESVAVRDAIRNSEFKDTVMGDIIIDADGLAVTESAALQWTDGKQVLVYPQFEGGARLRVLN